MVKVYTFLSIFVRSLDLTQQSIHKDYVEPILFTEHDACAPEIDLHFLLLPFFYFLIKLTQQSSSSVQEIHVEQKITIGIQWKL